MSNFVKVSKAAAEFAILKIHGKHGPRLTFLDVYFMDPKERWEFMHDLWEEVTPEGPITVRTEMTSGGPDKPELPVIVYKLEDCEILFYADGTSLVEGDVEIEVMA